MEDGGLGNEMLLLVLGALQEYDGSALNDYLISSEPVYCAVEYQLFAEFTNPGYSYKEQLSSFISNHNTECQKCVDNFVNSLPVYYVQQSSSVLQSNSNLSSISNASMTKISTTHKSPNHSIISSTSITSTVYQRPSSAAYATNSSSITQAKNITKRYDIDKTTLINKINAKYRQLDKNMQKLDELRRQLDVRERMLYNVKKVNKYIMCYMQAYSQKQAMSANEVKIQQQKLQYYEDRLSAVKYAVIDLSGKHPEYVCMVKGKSARDYILNLFKQLISKSINKIYEASKTATLKVYEQEVNMVSDNDTLLAEVNRLDSQRIDLLIKIKKAKEQYHKLAIENQQIKYVKK